MNYEFIYLSERRSLPGHPGVVYIPYRDAGGIAVVIRSVLSWI